MNKFLVKRILEDMRNAVNLITSDVYKKLGLQKKDLTKVPYPLVGLRDKTVLILGTINLLVLIGDELFEREM